MSITAMKQALEALDTCHWDYDSEEESYKTFDEDLVNNATEALRQAIEQAEKQEPVAWMRDDGTLLFADGNVFAVGQPLYTAPPKREWVGLTASEALACHRQSYDAQIGLLPSTFYHAIEAKLKEKNT